MKKAASSLGLSSLFRFHLCSMVSPRVEEFSSSTSQCAYDVFLSSRGKETRKSFTDQLYIALLDSGFHTFRDEEGIEVGENIKPELWKAIQDSKISIVVFSEDYASSCWCLDELLMILKRRRASGHEVLPIFYNMDPTLIKKQKERYMEAFARHEVQFIAEVDERKVEWVDKLKDRWAALEELADLGGMVSKDQDDGDESKFIQQVVIAVQDKINRTILNVSPYLIGTHTRAEDINTWLQDESGDVSLAAICGMGGIGKTTIAKVVYNLKFSSFEGGSFLENIREISGQPRGLIRLQKKLLSDILRGRKEKVYSIDEGIAKIKAALYCKRVLVVLDDVDKMEQLDAILGMRDWFSQGSKIIITTRNEQLPRAHETCRIYRVEKLDDAESLELFSWHAFGQDHPTDDYEADSRRMVHYCDGLPLAIKVLSTSLSGKSLDVWKSHLEKLKAIPNGKVFEKLKISYENLQDEHDKNLFLHIACFFVGKDKDWTVQVLNKCDFYTTIGIHNLIDRCMLSIDFRNKLRMHQLIQDMGREIVRQESPYEPGKRSRIWNHEESFDVLAEKTGAEKIEGLILDMHFLKGVAEGNSSEVVFETNAFAKMCKLRLLQLNFVQLSGSFEKFPKTLRWLCWHGFPFESIHNDFQLDNVVALDMRYSRLKNVWDGRKCFSSLKILNLSHSHFLAKTPDFSLVPNLERLILKDCVNLAEVHESIGNLKALAVMILKDCRNLRKLPTNFIVLKSFEKLDISGCSNLDELPTGLMNMKSLKVFLADRIDISRLLSTTGEPKSRYAFLWSLVQRFGRVPQLSRSPLPSSLVRLSLENCNLSDDVFPMDFSHLNLLRDLNLGRNPIRSLPECIRGLSALHILRLESCTELQSLLELPSLEILQVPECTSLQRITYQSSTSGPQIIELTNCGKLVDLEGDIKLEPIGNVDAEVIKVLGLHNVQSMTNVEMDFFNGVSANSTSSGRIERLPIQVPRPELLLCLCTFR
ncbi:disease resistance protein RPV1-like isoform X2 [Diospyros lotus]|uniref:disease resistance protein RPV1-like isoform X2 n=1 Tax=Diospyros lotus TaxID=55363 RepID=UPI00225227EF|nr:disease resistance protein RPV1-like isoform X2 [Diospyros lotus]